MEFIIKQWVSITILDDLKNGDAWISYANPNLNNKSSLMILIELWKPDSSAQEKSNYIYT